MAGFGRGFPSLRQLELLLALSTAEGIASAGARVGMTPSATSHALRALESTLGTALVDRHASGVELSHAGKQILPHVRDVFGALRIIQATAQASAGLHTGLLRVGSFGASSSLRVLPPLLDAFRARYPGVEVVVVERLGAEVEQDILERRIEIGVVELPKTQFNTLPIAVDELIAVLPEKHKLADLDVIDLRDLAQHPFILTHAGSQALVARMFARANIKPKVAHELSQVISIIEFVALGHGVSVVASLAVPRTHPGVVYRRLVPTSSRHIGLACLNERRLSPAAAALWEHARALRKR
jgi:DNA-binding transcriptional LysR family regulator